MNGNPTAKTAIPCCAATTLPAPPASETRITTATTTATIPLVDLDAENVRTMRELALYRGDVATANIYSMLEEVIRERDALRLELARRGYAIAAALAPCSVHGPKSLDMTCAVCCTWWQYDEAVKTAAHWRDCYRRELGKRIALERGAR